MSTRFLSILVSLALAAAANAQPTAFTYQGRLKDGAQPAAGLHDFRFRLWDAASGGTQVGTIQCADNVPVAAGLFTTNIDFGQNFTTSAPRFLEIEVRADTGLGCASAGGFIVLAPRQAVTPAPMATHARTAFSLAAADGSPAEAVVVDNSGRVGVGTSAPALPLHIAAEEPVLVLQDTGPVSTQSGYLGFWNANPSETAWVGFGTPGSPHFTILNARSGGDIQLLPGPGRNVGVGTTAPLAKLDVRGDIRLGPTGALRAPGGEENLRIIRGAVNSDGQIVRGTGFTAQRLEEGKYRITFTTSFSGAPTVTAMAERTSGNVRSMGLDFDNPTAGQVTIVAWDGTDFNDISFDFIAIGPR